MKAASLVCATFAVAVLVAGCASTPPARQADLCAVFDQNPDWYDYAQSSAKEWGTPVHIQMAFVRHESSYRSDARPPRKWFLFIPWGRVSSAKGYAQAQDPVWEEYQAERGRLFRSRSDMEDETVDRFESLFRAINAILTVDDESSNSTPPPTV